ncbi:MAG: DUF4381 domain-containing protein [Gammaproteobacteria bacterium]|nr:DUF4381 domain-containing protein [Gammaproteobacteria bacterium]
MEPQLLDQLRDIHLPQVPQWWPPAPGWWILAALALGLLTWGAIRLRRRWQRFRPVRAARQLHQRLTRELLDGSITPTVWLHRTNETLKRLAVHGLGHCETIPAWGDDWLRYLDGRCGERAFSEGVGRCLGEARFQPDKEVDTQALNGLVGRLLTRECRRFWRFSPTRACQQASSSRAEAVLRQREGNKPSDAGPSPLAAMSPTAKQPAGAPQ